MTGGRGRPDASAGGATAAQQQRYTYTEHQAGSQASTRAVANL